MLPPTTSAARQHIFRTYLQVQTWLGNYKDPEDWGWRRNNGILEPVCNKSEPAPQDLLKILACKCKGRCGAACGCRKVGLTCSSICKNCDGESCDNTPSIDEDVVDNEDDVEFDDGPNLQYYTSEDYEDVTSLNDSISINNPFNNDDVSYWNESTSSTSAKRRKTDDTNYKM
ncbi:hypothetical protein ALC60_11363 [Trachymyrmex zeteki]|uniref:Tesmin/TSO1-like CXC domain-containing protein n=1 Tax=Mycetomoellerius zeteki TaxID=64791 RepID=A0A151WP39_9HYME|nr:hypothetical protein ALC60_11363 [Trachymyrmex zeteki]